MWLWRKILNISWSDKVSNNEVLHCVEEEKSIISAIDQRQRASLGHTLCHRDFLSLVIEERVEGRKPTGRPRTEVLDRMKNGSLYQ